VTRRAASSLEMSALELAAQVGVAKPRARASKRSVERIAAEAAEMLKGGDWSKARPGHLVAFWASCHEHVYGVRPEEDLAPAQFSKACLRAAKVLRESFGGDPAKAVAFVSWTWARERGGKMSRRIGWALQFSAAMVGDFRVATAGRTR
jgi:hypothetical protein